MATLHSGYEPESSHALAARRDSELIALDTINPQRLEASNPTSDQPSFFDTKPPTAITQSFHPTEVATPGLYDSNIELTSMNPQHHDPETTEPEFTLPPVDGGKDAWLFLFSAFILEILVWGTFSPPLPPPFPTPPNNPRLPFRLRHLPRTLLLAPALRRPA